jgi:NAD(P)-dependent dehydrogenase (short-subunit alcohol dehydrogenase family)
MPKQLEIILKLIGKVAIVTGTSPNIGGGIAEALAAAGASVVCVDSKGENASNCANAIMEIGGQAEAVSCDVCDERAVRQTIDTTISRFGKIDIVVNNAAFFNKKGVLNMPLDEWSNQINVILTGAFLFTKYASQAMIERSTRGTIINIISTAGHQGEPGNVAYCTAKSGLLNFTRSVAMELAKHGIRVNSLTPTATDPSESFERARRWGQTVGNVDAVTQAFEPFRKRVPMQQLPMPSDYGQAAVFLASDDARMMTGTDLRVDAGALARYWAWEPSKQP